MTRSSGTNAPFDRPFEHAPRTREKSSRPRPYPAHLPLTLSAYRPHVLARDRLRLWMPERKQPLPVDRDMIPIPLSENDVKRVFDLLEFAYSEGTTALYGSGLLVYHVFCDLKGIPERQRAPISIDLLRSFIASIAGTYSYSHIDNCICAVRAWHALHGLSWPADDDIVRLLLKASKIVAPPAQKKRPPLSVDTMVTLRTAMDLADPLAAASWAALVLTFWCTARRGEFTLKTLTSFDPKKHVKLSDYRVQRGNDNTEVHIFHLPSTKCAPIEGEDVYFAPQPDTLADPLAALNNHLRINNPSSGEFLLSYADANGRRVLTRSAMESCLQRAAKRLKISLPPGHSARIGNVLWHLTNGTPLDATQIKGRWKSRAFQLYLREHAEIMSPYLLARSDIHDVVTRRILLPIR
ncbi:hypothetical protein PENSPDRAFT_678979 [Peniophora sp. CONT]|nr:hypothetical protein PENSPDRAFT_678979 [Peniophora sp. CONT]